MSDEFVLTKDNYYSKEANDIYCSFHDFLNCIGYMEVRGCEARYIAMRKGEWQEEKTLPMLVGSYCDSFYEGTLDDFKKSNPEIFTQKGELKAPYRQAEKMIARTLEDKLFQQAMSGKKQEIMTGYWAGANWKIKMDSYMEHKFITDFKTVSDLHRAWKIRDYGYATFIEAYFYTGQLALYQKIVEINTGEKLACYIAAVSKSDNPEIAVINIPQNILDHALNYIEMNMNSYLSIRNGESEPIRCESCPYCIRTRKLTAPIGIEDLLWEQ